MILTDNKQILVNAIGSLNILTNKVIIQYPKLKPIELFYTQTSKIKVIETAKQKLLTLNYTNRKKYQLNIAVPENKEKSIYKVSIQHMHCPETIQCFIYIDKDNLNKMETTLTWKKKFNQVLLCTQKRIFLDALLTGSFCKFKNNILVDYTKMNLIPIANDNANENQNENENANANAIIKTNNKNVLINYIDPINKKIFIDKTNWKYLNSKCNKERIIKDFIELKELGKIKMPMKDITLEEVQFDFCQMLSINHCAQEFIILRLKKDFFVKSKNVPLPSKLGYISNNVLYGSKSSDYFHQELRIKTRAQNYTKSVYDAWTQLNKTNCVFLNKIWHYKLNALTSQKLSSILALTFGMPSQFRPLAAKELIYYYLKEFRKNNTASINVLDPCAGWGDRLAGFTACSLELNLQNNSKIHLNEIVLIEPRIEAKERYQNQMKEYQICFNAIEKSKIFKSKKLIMPTLKIYSNKAEIQMKNLESNSFAIIFTSPPYFDREQYHDTTTDKNIKLDCSYDNWCNTFLKPLLIESERILIDDGYIMLNINNVLSKDNKTEYPLCQDTLKLAKKYCTKLNLVGSLGYEMSQTTVFFTKENKELHKKLPCCEPIYIWKKIKL